MLDAGRWRKLSRICAAGLAGGLLLTEDAVVYPPCAARFLIEEAVTSGMEVVRGRSEVEVGEEGARLDDGYVSSSRLYRLATGVAGARS